MLGSICWSVDFDCPPLMKQSVVCGVQNGQSKLASSELLAMVQGVASGMKYLADRGYVHTVSGNAIDSTILPGRNKYF